MPRRSATKVLLVVLLAVLAPFAASCGDDGDGDDDGVTAAVLGGDVEIVVGDDLDAAPTIDTGGEQFDAESLEIVDIVEGDGPEATDGSTVSLQYVGVLTDGEQFDASWDTGEPITLTLGSGEVIPGWDEGIVGMKEGGRRLLVIPPSLAYGAEGRPPVIPPAATLVFVVDLVDVS